MPTKYFAYFHWMERNHLLLVVVAFAALACNNSITSSADTSSMLAVNNPEQPAPTVEVDANSERKSTITTTGCRINFGGLEIYMPSIIADGYSKTNVIEQDTVYIGLTDKSRIYDEPFVVMGDLVDIEIQETESQGILIADGSSLRRLDEWLVVDSPWRNMYMENGEYISFSRFSPNTAPFPIILAEDIQDAVRSLHPDCTEEFIESIHSPFEDPCQIYTRSRTIRISGKRMYTGQPVVKYLIFNDGFGC